MEYFACRYLDDVALHHLIDALCKLSAEAMELAYSNRVNTNEYRCTKTGHEDFCLLLSYRKNIWHATT